MLIDVHILDTHTGEAAIYHDPDEWTGWDDERGPEIQIGFMWADGNYSCDCNRGLFFLAAKAGSWSDEDHPPCGDARYVVQKIVNRATGAIVYQDDARIRPSVAAVPDRA